MTAIADTGLLVAFLYSRDAFHRWAVGEFERAQAPFATCEAVLAEAAHLLAGRGVPRDRVAGLVTAGAVRVTFEFQREATAVRSLLERYADTPMDWADACLVRMTELVAAVEVVTVDSDFLIYRRHGSQAIPVRMPPERTQRAT